MLNDLLLYVIILAIAVTILRTPFVKGVIGELIVNILSKILLDKKEYTLIRNATLPTDDGSTQIDHIIVSKYGIFVIETKNMRGWIFGSPNQKSWTQVIFKKKTKFQNPLHQNYKHVKTLERLLGLPSDCFFSVIVFMGDCTLKPEMPENVVYPLGYIRYVKSKTTHKLKDDEISKIVQSIEECRFDRSIKTHIDHARHVKEIVKEKENCCPKCGSPLVKRTVKKGPNAGDQFLGCSGFPKCRYAVSDPIKDAI